MPKVTSPPTRESGIELTCERGLHWECQFGGASVKLPRRKFLHLAAGAAALPAMTRVASALDYPTRPVHIIVPFPPGGAPDIVGRLLSQWLSQRLGQQFIVENRPGAAGNIGNEIVAHAQPDGYTLLLGTSATTVNVAFYTNLNYDFTRDVIPVAAVGMTPLCDGDHAVVPGENRCRISRLCEGQSGQDQHGLAGHRDHAPRLR